MPAHVRAPAGTGDRGSGSVDEAYSDVVGFGRQTITAVDTWATRQSQAIRARLCLSIPLPVGLPCP